MPSDILLAVLFVSEPIRWRCIFLRCQDMDNNWSSTVSVMPSELKRRNSCNAEKQRSNSSLHHTVYLVRIWNCIWQLYASCRHFSQPTHWKINRCHINNYLLSALWVNFSSKLSGFSCCHLRETWAVLYS